MELQIEFSQYEHPVVLTVEAQQKLSSHLAVRKIQRGNPPTMFLHQAPLPMLRNSSRRYSIKHLHCCIRR
ncbi:hypothetical protein L6164_016168 [Bauhinia variegata]|uniref:Uncharacterized protein n=1 Tax=Bauhinia variegata TaxID=167791 RepID=A0ACB9NN24_BAUVA|nr:hypothetical protein L6164_016168 [Bauhinia variegata]